MQHDGVSAATSPSGLASKLQGAKLLARGAFLLKHDPKAQRKLADKGVRRHWRLDSAATVVPPQLKAHLP